jgi:hypothetical protein
VARKTLQDYGRSFSMLLDASAVVAALAPAAHADTTGGGDTQFLEIVHLHIAGLTASGGDATLTGLGHAICNSLAQNFGDRSSAQQQLANKWKSESDAAWAITASAVAYCPRYIVSSDRW